MTGDFNSRQNRISVFITSSGRSSVHPVPMNGFRSSLNGGNHSAQSADRKNLWCISKQVFYVLSCEVDIGLLFALCFQDLLFRVLCCSNLARRYC